MVYVVDLKILSISINYIIKNDNETFLVIPLSYYSNRENIKNMNTIIIKNNHLLAT
ncbi:hypothetical protein BACFRA24663_07100 [Bacteroides fragilis]